MYSEFVITMIIPAVGLLLIFLFYHGWLWRIQRSTTSTSTANGSTDAEKGALHGQDVASLEPDSDAMACRGVRDLCTWLAIGWLFMVSPVPSQIRMLCSNFLTVCCPPGLHHPLPHDLPIVCLQGHRATLPITMTGIY